MKSKIMFIALYSAAFMFPSIGSVDTAGAQTEHCAAFSGAPKAACEAAASAPAPVVGDISHCDAFSGPALAACVDAAHGSAPAPFDDGLMGAPAMGNQGQLNPGMPQPGIPRAGDPRGGDQQYDHRNDMNSGGLRDDTFVEGDQNSGKCGKPVCPQ